MAWQKESNELRLAYSDSLIEYAGRDERICVVEADLMASASTQRFKKLYPERTFNVGVAEANLIGIASGMSVMGKIPFTHTFTPFASRRCCDQVMISAAYAKLNVKMVGTDPGICAELNGGTHMCFEDIAIMRSIPSMVIFEPVDSVQFKKIFPQILEHYGPVYIRLFRKNAWSIYDAQRDEFVLGKGNTLRSGRDVTLVATGIMVKEALEAAEMLSLEGIEAEVINISTIKPLDADIILKSTARTGCCVTAENANVIGGLGSAVAECLAEKAPCPVLRVGVTDRFGQVGKLDFLQEEYGLNAATIAETAKKAIALK